MKQKLLTVSALLITTLLCANPYQSQNEDFKHAIEIGNKTSMILLKTLGSNLAKNMKEGGPIQAFNFCNTEAYPLTDGVNSQLDSGVSVKRISLKYRNPANAPQKGEEAVLESLENLKKSQVVLPPFVIQKVSKNQYKYYKPLLINKGVCLKCHGNLNSNKKLQKLVNKSYPEDKAVGYKMHDLRGAIVVTITK